MKKLVVILCLLVTQLSCAQNLIPNGGFETFTLCPDNFDQLYRATGWVNPNTWSPDYFNRCAIGGIGTIGVPLNDFGNQQPHGGDAYVGIGIFCGWPSNVREFIQIRLTRPLEAGTCYYLEMYVNIGEFYSKYTTDDWGAHFSVLPQSMQSLTVTPQIINATGNYPNFSNWKLSDGFFYASGGEEYITIGNFKTDANTDTIPIPSNSIWSDIYMYIDDVSLTTCTNVKLPEYEKESEGRVFPTIFGDELNAKVNTGDDAELIIYNTSGELIVQTTFKKFCSIQTESWHPDVYFYVLRTQTFVVSKGKLVKQ